MKTTANTHSIYRISICQICCQKLKERLDPPNWSDAFCVQSPWDSKFSKVLRPKVSVPDFVWFKSICVEKIIRPFQQEKQLCHHVQLGRSYFKTETTYSLINNTLPKTNVVPENGWLEDEISLTEGQSDATLVSGSVHPTWKFQFNKKTTFEKRRTHWLGEYLDIESPDIVRIISQQRVVNITKKKWIKMVQNHQPLIQNHRSFRFTLLKVWCVYTSLFCGIYTHITKVGNWGLYVIDVPNPPPRGVLLLAIIGDFLSR